MGRQRLPAIVGAKGAGGRDGDEHAVGIGLIEKDGMQAHAAGSRLPARPRAVAAQSGKFLPGKAPVGGAEQRRVFHSSVDRVRFGQGGFEVPDALELPGMLGAVIPLVSRERLPGFGRGVVDEFIALSFRRALRRCGFARGSAWLYPGFAAIVGALDDLPEPSAGLRGIDSVRIHASIP